MIKEKTYTIKHEYVKVDMNNNDSIKKIIKSDLKDLKKKGIDAKFVTWYGKNQMKPLNQNSYLGDIYIDYLEQDFTEDGRSIKIES